MNFLALGLDCGLTPCACLVEISCSVPVNNFGSFLPSFQPEGTVEILLCMGYIMQCPFMGRLWARGCLMLPGAILAEAAPFLLHCPSYAFQSPLMSFLRTHISRVSVILLTPPFTFPNLVSQPCLFKSQSNLVSSQVWIIANPHHL